jgi:hypothetical protein
MFRRLLAGGVAALALALPTTAPAHYYDGCRKAPCKRHVIKPWRATFLGPVGACESGTDHRLHHGLRATSAGGHYLGRYQFGWPDWHRAGGKGDPRDAGPLEQAYRAVVWLHRNGRTSWPNC